MVQVLSGKQAIMILLSQNTTICTAHNLFIYLLNNIYV